MDYKFSVDDIKTGYKISGTDEKYILPGTLG